MKKIMFVCMGNICRSPLAQAVMENLVVDQGLEKGFCVNSSGIIAYHQGEPSDSRMKKTAAKHGIGMNHLSQQLKEEDLRDYDLVLGMDTGNMEGIRVLDRNSLYSEKIKMFRDYDPLGTGEVPDPYYGGAQGFDDVFTMVERTCKNLLEILK